MSLALALIICGNTDAAATSTTKAEIEKLAQGQKELGQRQKSKEYELNIGELYCLCFYFLGVFSLFSIVQFQVCFQGNSIL